ncbi:MAG: hypothetical protein U0104_13915 [Gemmatimonadales bacterium]
MIRRFRPFRYTWSLLLVLGGLVAATLACAPDGQAENDTATYCQQHPENC